jgi:Kdo2-lipid IVA lauroyltransferase/acyltransferase
VSILSATFGALRPPRIDTADLKHRLQYGLFRGALAVFRVVPLDWPVSLCARVWRVIGPRSGRHRRVLANLALAYPDMTQAERDAIALAMWENLGRVVAETMLLDRILDEPGRIEIVNRDELEAAMHKPGPKIGVTLHMGNWELAAAGCAMCGGNPAGVYRPLTNPYVDRTLLKQREHLYSGGLFTKGTAHDAGPDGQRTARLITGYVRQGGNLAFVLDQVDRRGIAVPFFGMEAKFTPVPSMIARHVGARVWMARCLRIGKRSRFQVELKELQMERTENRKGDIQAITAEIFAQFEAWIREAPEQWMWWNTRWEVDAAAPDKEAAAAGTPPVAEAVSQTH